MSRRKQEHPQPRKRLLNAEAELLHDTLTCGNCQKVFVLSEIVKFIQHKVHSCNKENNFLVVDRDRPRFDDDSDDREEPPGLPVIGHTRTPISAPICNRKGLHHQHLHLHRNRVRSEKPILSLLGHEKPEPPPGTPPLSLTVERLHGDGDANRRAKSEGNPDDGRGKRKDLKEEVVVKVETKDSVLRSSPKLMSDAETNTIITEPSTYTCSTCKQTFPSAWTLVQHAQHMHGMKIYLVTPYPGRNSNSTPSCVLPPPPSSAPPPSLIHGTSGTIGLPLPPVLPPSSVSMNGPTNAHSHHVLPQQSLALENHPALQLLRMPLGDRQFPPAPLNAPSIFARPSSQEFRMDLLSGSSNNNGENQFHRLNHHHGAPLPPLGIGNFDHHHHHHHNPFVERGPLGLDTRTRPPPMSLGFEPQMDFYSQRLRQLAGATSPTMAPSPRKLTPPFSHPPMSSSSQPSTPTSTPQPPLNLHPGRSLTPSSSQHHNQVQGSSASSTSSKGGGTDLLEDSNKLLKTWSCEFCNKSFRFQSNLIVHRRCHTGEKPYKCPICRHSCSQASKLKRHMKTHQNNGKSTPGSENNSAESPRSTPDSTSESKKRRRSRSLPEDEDGSDGQTADNEEEEEELDDDDDEEEEELDDDEDLDDSNEVLMAEDLSTKGHVSSTPTSRASPAEQNKTKNSDANNDNNNGTKSNPGNGESTSTENSETTANKDRDSSLPRHSLISEVMDKIGLSNIQQYHEAYQKALEESGVKTSSSVKNERPLSSEVESNASTGPIVTENGPEKLKREESNSTSFNNHLGFGSNKSIIPHNLDFGHSIYGAFDHHHSNPHHSHFDSNKRLKLDIGEHLRNAADRESLYAGLWLPSVQSAHRDIFAENNSDHPRLNKSSSSESALKSVTPTSLGCRSMSPRPGTSGGNSMPGLLSNSNAKSTNKEQRRNDTCEYCGKVFKNCSNLTVHRRSHTGEKPYKCELCSYACAQSSKLTRHMKTHGRLGKDVYRCRFCDMPFSVPSTLEKHMRKCVVNQNTPGVAYVDRDSDSKDLA